MTEELFYKYAQNQCSKEERNAVEKWLEKCTDAELRILLQTRWDASYEKMPDIIGDDLWDIVYKKITLGNVVTMGIQNKHKPFVRSVWMAAACILLLLVSGYSIFLMKDKTVFQTNQKTNVSKSADTITWITVDNVQQEKKIILLKDNSEIVLFPSSSIRYASDFNNKERNVYLIGRANFTIAKNKAKPFTVFSDEIATTAVGTRFQVNRDFALGVISVKLFEGIVRIQSTRRSIQGWENGKLLYPGEEVRFENGKATAKLNVVLEKLKVKTELTTADKSLTDEIVFSNTPLSEVFETMGKMFGINISYSKNDVAGMHLTTTISIKDKPASILDAIVQMNALSYQKNEKGFMIVGLANPNQ